MKFLHSILVLMLLSLACSTISCSGTKEQETLNRAEMLMESHPDSALTILSTIDKEQLSDNRQKAKYALLMSMALDKNYIDTTSFEVLQPAIDYYLEKGTPDERLQTYYYQGRIFQNQGDRDKALNSFVKGVDDAANCTDSISLIRTYAAQAYLFYEFYDFDSYTNKNLKAANLCNKISHKDYEFECLLNALNGSIIIGKQELADSILNICNNINGLSQSHMNKFLGHKLAYALKFGSEQDIRRTSDNYEGTLALDMDGKLNLASAYNKLGKNDVAKSILDDINSSGFDYDTLKYQSISVLVLKDIGNYKDALSTYRDFSIRVDSINSFKFDQKAASIEEKHQLELNAQTEARRHSRIMWGCIGGIVILIMGVFILLLLIRSKRAKEELVLEKIKAKDAENAKLKSEKENLVLENINLQLERDKKALEAENLTHRVDALENESDSLKALIGDKEELPIEVQREIKVRIEMLNSLLASYITNNEQYEKPYDVWIKELTDNKDEFMNSNRLAFQVSHPRFIQYFEDHGLTTDEINYVCLYAIGLRGKEVGNYMNKRSHVNTSSAIRKKLGIDKHETNIGIYVRKLLKNL